MPTEPNKLAAPVRVTNISSRHEKERVKSQLLQHREEPAVPGKAELEHNQTKLLDLAIVKYAAGYYSASLSSRIAEEGESGALIGASLVDIR